MHHYVQASLLTGMNWTERKWQLIDNRYSSAVGFRTGYNGKWLGMDAAASSTAPILLCLFLNRHHRICFEIGTETGGGGATRRFVLVRHFLISVWLEHNILWRWRCYHEILVHHNLSSKRLSPWEYFAQWNNVRSTVFANCLRDTLVGAV